MDPINIKDKEDLVKELSDRLCNLCYVDDDDSETFWEVKDEIDGLLVRLSKLHKSEKCSICHSLVHNDCVDWECMYKTKTDQIVCKECAKLFKNCQGGEIPLGSRQDSKKYTSIRGYVTGHQKTVTCPTCGAACAYY